MTTPIRNHTTKRIQVASWSLVISQIEKPMRTSGVTGMNGVRNVRGSSGER